MNVQEVTLDLDKEVGVGQWVRVGQGDKSGTTIVATVYDNGTAFAMSGMTAKFLMRTPTNGYVEDDHVNVSGNTLTYVVDEEHCASAAGVTDECYFQILQGDTVIASTSRFSMRVLRAATQGADPAQSYSDDIVSATTAARQAANDARDAMEEIGTAVEDAAQAAESAAQAVQDAQTAIADADTAKREATSAANAATAAANNANSKANLANTAANNANTAANATNSATQRAEAAIAAMGDISEQAVPLMSADTRGGAKLEEHGGLALRDGALGIGSLVQESDGYARGGLAEVTAKGHAEQDGTPTPDNPVPIQVVRGHEVTGKTGRFVDLIVKQGNTTLSTAHIPLPQRGWVAGLPDGTADSLRLDGAGKCEWTLLTSEVVLDGSSDEVWNRYNGGGDKFYFYYSIRSGTNPRPLLMSNRYTFSQSSASPKAGTFIANGSDTNWNGNVSFFPPEEVTEGDSTLWREFLSSNPVTVLYPLVTPITEDCGYVEDWPTDIPEGATLSIRELDSVGIKYFIDNSVTELAKQWYEKSRSEYEDRLQALEEAMATIITGS